MEMDKKTFKAILKKLRNLNKVADDYYKLTYANLFEMGSIGYIYDMFLNLLEAYLTESDFKSISYPIIDDYLEDNEIKFINLDGTEFKIEDDDTLYEFLVSGYDEKTATIIEE